MSQQFQVLCCYACKIYQVHPVKKLNKWNCKVCGEKQSTKQIFCKGVGSDCRKIVQKLNSLEQQKTCLSAKSALEDTETVSHDSDTLVENRKEESPVSSHGEGSKKSAFEVQSKWNVFIDDSP